MNSEDQVFAWFWASLAAVLIALCAMTAFLGYQSANNQTVNQIGVACVTAGNQWANDKCVDAGTTILLTDD
jgi:hypothetical protein